MTSTVRFMTSVTAVLIAFLFPCVMGAQAAPQASRAIGPDLTGTWVATSRCGNDCGKTYSGSTSGTHTVLNLIDENGEITQGVWIALDWDGSQLIRISRHTNKYEQRTAQAYQQHCGTEEPPAVHRGELSADGRTLTYSYSTGGNIATCQAYPYQVEVFVRE